MPKSVKIAMVQDNFLVGDVRGNAGKIIQSVSKAKEAGCDLVLFPELALTGYPPEDLLYRPSLMKQVDDELERVRQQTKNIAVILGAPRKTSNQLFNAMFWFCNGELVEVYRKRILPNYSVFDEVRYFARGDECKVVEFNGIKFGLAICEDVWEKLPVEESKKAGAQVMLVINASPFHIGKYEERVEMLGQRIKETAMPIVYLNMVGGQDELVFDGESLVIDSAGQVRLKAAAFEPAFEIIETDGVNITVTSNASINPLGKEESVYKALVLGVRDFVQKNGFEQVVIGLSGGVDSALTLAIAVDALGADHVHAVLMPSRYTADISNEDAQDEISRLGVSFDVVPIEPAFEAFLGMLKKPFQGYDQDTTEENIQARCRGLILMAISNKTGRMVLTTGNKSEMAVGYATLYGDMSGGFAPLKDVSKTLVYQLCRYRNSISEAIPGRVLTRPPSAELRPDQCDQDSLPDYDVLDRILELSVEQDMPLKKIIEITGFDESTVQRVVDLVRLNEYKRRQAAPGVRITKRAFGRDRRYPITSGYCRR